jgi:tetratricopeptide (TPR) repeat protein
MTTRTLVLIAAVVALGTSPVHAQKKAPPPVSARAHAKAGQDAFKAERYDEAIAEYQAAYALTPEPGLLYNIARAYHRKGDKPQALSYYRRYLTDEPNGAASGEAREYSGALAREIQEDQQPPAPQPAAPAPAPAPAPPAPLIAAFGPKAGVTASIVATADVDSSFRAGFVGGGFLSLSLTDWLELQFELLFEQKRSLAGDTQRLVALQYVEIPLLFKPTYRGFYAVLGPYLGVAVSWDTTFDSTFKAVDVGLAAGIGYGIEAGPGRVILEARFELGLTTIIANEDAKNRTLSFTLGYAFR